MIKKNVLLAIGALIGTIIGAGIFAIPYVVSKSGVITSFFYFLIIGFVVLLLHLFFGEVVLRTKEKHRLTGYAEKYLGKKAKLLVIVSVIFGTVGALLSYIILGGKFLNIVFGGLLTSYQFSLIIWVLLSFFVYLGIRAISRVELFMNIFLFLVFLLIFALSFLKVSPANFEIINKNYLLLPFGIFLFSLVGWNAVPEIEGIILRKTKLKKVIFYGVIIPAVFYFVFGLVIAGVSGTATSKEAFEGLLPYLGKKIIILGGIFGVLAVSTSFLVLADYLKNTLFLDLKFPYLLSFLIASFLPLFLFLAGFREFLEVVAFVGTFVGLIEGLIITLVYQRAKKLGEKEPAYNLKIPKFLIRFVVLVLFLGAISQIVYYLS